MCENGILLTIPQLMARWQVSRSTLDTWRRKGLPTVEDGKVGPGNHVVRFRLPDVEKWEKDHSK